MQNLLTHVNETQTEYPRTHCIHQLFEEQVARTPLATALMFGDLSLTYQELNDRADALAAALKEHGVGPGQCVGVYLHRCTELIVALLGILKAGGAYLPLDPNNPRERTAFLMRDAGADLTVTTTRLRAELPGDENTVLCLDAPLPSSTAPTAATPPTSDSLAYVMYTSGSTGQPKGVEVTHRNVVRLVLGTRYAHFGPDEVFLQFAPLAFDASTFEIWGALLHGACLVLFPEELQSLEQLAQTLEESKITTLWLTASLFHQMVDLHLSSLLGLRQLLAGGDALSAPHCRAYLKAAGPGKLINGYGPTEGTTFSCCHTVMDLDEAALTVPIGRPIANTRVYVLDGALEPVPVGVPGELYIAGDGLARGYRNRPDLTKERFLNVRGERLYKTGDTVKWTKDEELEFIGRKDNQIKLRGYRIELQEIEARLQRHPNVKYGAVRNLPDSDHSPRLVAYWVGGEVSAGELRAFLADLLPVYMIPSAFVPLDTLPLTANGKLDSQALPNPFNLSVSAENARPLSLQERALQEIWEEVLGTGNIGADTSFFELGGNSLTAARIATRIRQRGLGAPSIRTILENPTIEQLSDTIARAPQTIDDPIPALGPALAPLSFGQKRLWFLEQLAPSLALYNIDLLLTLRGPLQRECLQAALQQLCQRHDVLRTTFEEQEGELYQRVAPSLGVVLTVQPWSDEALEAERSRPFDLALGPLFRATLWSVEPAQHKLLLTLHHTIADGWSLTLLKNELVHLYRRNLAQQPPALPPLPIQYTDFAVWQTQRWNDSKASVSLDFWRETLENLPVLDLPTDRPRPRTQSFRGQTLQATLGSALLTRLKQLSQQHQATLFMTLFGAYTTLLSIYSGQEELVVGTPVAGRDRAESEALIGFFVNTLALRVDLSGDPTVSELLQRTREHVLAALAHDDVPLEKLVEILQPNRDLGRNPLFQVVFVLQTEDREPVVIDSLSLETERLASTVAKFDLTLEVTETTAGLECRWEFSTNLFDIETIERLHEHWRVLLEAFVDFPERRLSQLSIVTPEEEARLLAAGTPPALAYPSDQCVHQLFESQVARCPEAVAVICGESALTYRELNTRSDQLAQCLLTQGVSPGSIVGLLMERSLELIVGLLAIVKLGGAYLPIDSNTPAERLRFMLEDAGAVLTLTQRSLQAQLPATPSWCIEDTPSVPHAATDLAKTYPDDLLYVMYTSGSTGQPKGVAVTHQNVVRLVTNTNYAPLGPDEVFLQLAPVAFDAATFEIWGSLLNGAKLVLYPPKLTTLEELSDVLRQHHVTTLWLTAGLFHLVVDDALEALSGVRQVLAGGDVLSLAHVRRFLKAYGPGRLTNGYGPTEGTTFSTFHPVQELPESAPSVPIGRPISHTQVYVLDRNRNLAPFGVPGELYIGGDGLARGYVNRPELTQERFVEWRGQRLYRTGDLVKWNAQEELEFLGRLDYQVKVRGYRIELQEIEAALLKHGQVRNAIAVVHNDSIVAYLVGDSIASPEIKRALQTWLPDYMIPSQLLFLPQLPQTSTGKVDRNSLPSPDSLATAPQYNEPVSATEERLRTIWQDILKTTTISPVESFFDRGGHSLLAVQLFSKIEREFGIRLPLATLFATPTLRGLATLLEQPAHTSRPWQSLVAIQPEGARPPLFCVHSGGGNLLNYRLIANTLGPDQPVFGFQARGLDGVQEPLTTVEAMATAYIHELQANHPHGPYRLVGISGGATIAFEMASQLVAKGEKIALLAMIDGFHLGTFVTLKRSARLDAHLGRLLHKGAEYFRTLKNERKEIRQRSLSTSPSHTVRKAVIRALDAYTPKGYPGTVTLLLTKDSGYRTAHDPRLAWEAYAEGGVELHFIPGDHGNMTEEPHVHELATKLRRCLDRCLNERG